MPLATNPTAKFDIVLLSDQGLADAEQPTFVFHYLSGADVEELGDVMTRLGEAKTGDEAMDRVYRAVGKHLVGWRNMTDRDGKAVKLAGNALKKVIGLDEIFELAFSLMNRQAVTAADKKKSDSQSASATGRPAKGAKGRKSVRTNPAPPSQ